MSDLKILKKDGWHELYAVSPAVQENVLDIKELWKAVAQNDLAMAWQVLSDAGYDIPKLKLSGIKLIAVPDDLIGESYRLWVQYS